MPAKAKPSDPKEAPIENRERLKRLAVRVETVTLKLTQLEIEDTRAHVMDLLAVRDGIDEKLKSIKAEYRAKIAEVDERLNRARTEVCSGRRDIEIPVEEWLTRSNEVVRVRTDTGEQIGARTAHAEELQEELFPDGAPAAEDNFPTSAEAFGGDVS